MPCNRDADARRRRMHRPRRGTLASAEATVVPTAVAFDGADYENQAAKTAHGKRLATLFQCAGCHGADYSGTDFGAGFPIVKGLWASNISRVIPAMSDAALERLLREGVHPDREDLCDAFEADAVLVRTRHGGADRLPAHHSACGQGDSAAARGVRRQP